MRLAKRLEITRKLRDEGVAHVLSGENDMVYNEVDNKRIKITEYPVEFVEGKLKVPAISAVIYKFSLLGFEIK